jgi:hypothetical protein
MTLGGFKGAQGLKNNSKTWLGFSGLWLIFAFAHAWQPFEARCMSRFLCPAVPTWTLFLQSGHSKVLLESNWSVVLLYWWLDTHPKLDLMSYCCCITFTISWAFSWQQSSSSQSVLKIDCHSPILQLC